MRAAIISVNTKKAFGEFWDDVEQKIIPRRSWSSEMKTFAAEKIAAAPKPPFIFKLTIWGWIFVLLIVALFAYLIYDSTKPPLPQSEVAMAMEKTPAPGDIFFGNYELYKEKGNPVGAEVRFGWFKISKVEAGTYFLVKSTEMNKSYKPKEQMNSSSFETEEMPPVKITEQTGYNIRFKSDDGKATIYITDKK